MRLARLFPHICYDLYESSTMLPTLKHIAKRVLYPGLDLHTRCRYRYLGPLIQGGPLNTLDAGFGNGALSYLAYRKGNRVLGVSFNAREVRDTQAYFTQLNIPTDQIDLRELNLYNLRQLDSTFDQIICSETLEHIARDGEMVQLFADLLRPGGRLILCCPHARHPEHALGRTNEPETGYHVRDGYTLESYGAILAPTGLRITQVLGIGSPLLCKLDLWLRLTRLRVGDLGALPLFIGLIGLTRFDRPNPPMPFSLTVVAEKI